MTIWDSLTGRKSTASPSAQSSNPFDAVPTDSAFPPSSGNSSSGPTVPSFLDDPSLLHPLSNLSQDALDYLKLEDSVLSDLPGGKSALPSRGWSDDLCYGTGCTYLTALMIGGGLGFAEGARSIPAGAPGRIQLNAILNGVTRRGPFLGNSAGVIAMLYNGVNSYIGYVRGKHDAGNSVAAGALSGMLFRSTKGVKPMLISGGLVASAAGAWAFARQTVFPSD
ncbi:putative mitochondrial import inner membrane translocase subunit TIM23 [Microthyrium microscopicum]|uniref:Putative mitochondrial import inner membrane translocase subunit TIM23 n=1 Tax=Microthyrium microscopicum TaxID=703497 RepID=A0A6A6UD83_9PEZI|nr:putative mitochondrial import inner membrane translocase subunit TIM23 [Microthyrium microscopicum]